MLNKSRQDSLVVKAFSAFQVPKALHIEGVDPTNHLICNPLHSPTFWPTCKHPDASLPPNPSLLLHERYLISLHITCTCYYLDLVCFTQSFHSTDPRERSIISMFVYRLMQLEFRKYILIDLPDAVTLSCTQNKM